MTMILQTWMMMPELRQFSVKVLKGMNVKLRPGNLKVELYKRMSQDSLLILGSSSQGKK